MNRDQAPYDETESPLDPRTEDPGNFKRTPPVHETEQDPLNSGSRFNSNHILIATLVGGLALAVVLAFLYL